MGLLKKAKKQLKDSQQRAKEDPTGAFNKCKRYLKPQDNKLHVLEYSTSTAYLAMYHGRVEANPTIGINSILKNMREMGYQIVSVNTTPVCLSTGGDAARTALKFFTEIQYK